MTEKKKSGVTFVKSAEGDPAHNKFRQTADEVPERYIWVKDPELSRTGFSRIEDAQRAADDLRARHPEPHHRVRVRMRSRTGLFDTLVKVRMAVKS